MKLLVLMTLLALIPNPALAAFVDNGNGTVTDTITCLQWQKGTIDATGDGDPDALSWQQALAAAEGLTLAGKSDWRLPDINELRSLVDYSRYDPVIDPVLAATTQPSHYWSSTTCAGGSDSVRTVAFEYGGYESGHSKSYGYYARAVRGGQCGATWTPSGATGRIYHSPRFGLPGTTFTESGTGFTPNSTVTLHFRNHLGEEQTPVQKATDASGNYSLTYTAPMDKPLGTHTWWAVDDTTGGMSEMIGYLITSPPGTQTNIAIAGTTVLPEIRVNLSFGTLKSEGTFDSAHETFVIVHG